MDIVVWQFDVNHNVAHYIIRVISNTGMILGLRPANERRRYFVTTSLIGGAQT